MNSGTAPSPEWVNAFRPDGAPDERLIVLRPDQIRVSDRLRPVDEDHARQIGDSMRETRQITPIEVRPPGPDGLYPLTSGAHRVFGARHAGLTLLARVVDAGEDEARLAEIDENLVRHELNPLDEAVFLAERRALYLRLYPQTKHGTNQHTRKVGAFAKLATPPEQMVLRFSEDTARRVGLSERRIQRALTRAARIAPDAVALLRGSALARNGVDLDALANTCPPDRQADAVRLVLEGRAPNLRGAIRLATGAADTAARPDRAYERLMRGWALASRAERARFLNEVLTNEEFFAAWTICGPGAREGFFAALHDEGELDGLLEAAGEHADDRPGRGDDDPADLDDEAGEDAPDPVAEETEADRLLARAVSGGAGAGAGRAS